MASADGVSQSSSPSTAWNSSEPITYDEMQALSQQVVNASQAGETLLDVVMIDVRESVDYEQGHIPGSYNLPISVFEQALSLDPDVFARRHHFAKPVPTAQIALYCRSGRRSTIALGIAAGAGWSRVRNYKGSWNEWCERRDASAHEKGETGT